MVADRNVFLENVTPEAAVDKIAGISQQAFSGTALGESAPQFTEFACRSFRAQHAVRDQDLVIQFFVPKHAVAALDTPNGRVEWMKYWQTRFPEVLSPTAQRVFEADYPRILAKYTEELLSWWFKARGFGLVTDPNALAHHFYEELDKALQARS